LAYLFRCESLTVTWDYCIPKRREKEGKENTEGKRKRNGGGDTKGNE
jgi:hypothetical protein